MDIFGAQGGPWSDESMQRDACLCGSRKANKLRKRLRVLIAQALAQKASINQLK